MQQSLLQMHADLPVCCRSELLGTDRQHAVWEKVLARSWHDAVHGCGVHVARVLAHVMTMPCRSHQHTGDLMVTPMVTKIDDAIVH